MAVLSLSKADYYPPRKDASLGSVIRSDVQQRVGETAVTNAKNRQVGVFRARSNCESLLLAGGEASASLTNEFCAHEAKRPPGCRSDPETPEQVPCVVRHAGGRLEF